MEAPPLLECRYCGAKLPAHFLFCGACGRRLALLEDDGRDRGPGSTEPIQESAAPKVPRAPERIQLTVMFADLVGSTALSFRLDPEEFRTVLRSYQAISAEAIEAQGGYVAQYLGDGILAYFGYPTAYEDEVQRAIFAGLELAEGMRALNRRFKDQYGVDLAVRMAVHTGVVVVGEVGGGHHREALALGGAPNVAARLQALAGRNELVASEATCRLLGARLRTEDLGVHELKGVEQPVRAFRVLGLSPPLVEAVEPDRPLEGRTEEMEVLRNVWEKAKAGTGQAVLISGESGMGKSRLLGTLARSLSGEARRILFWQCFPSFSSSPLHPVIQSLRGLISGGERNGDAGLQSADPAERLGLLLTGLGLGASGTNLLFASLLSIPVEGADEVSDSPRAVREKTEAALAAMIEAMSHEGPLLLAAEDLHWADPSTVSLVGRLVTCVTGWPVMILLTARPSVAAPWAQDGHLRLELNRLNRTQVEALLADLAQGRAVDEEVTDLIFSKTGGNPLFVEELFSTLLESGALLDQDGTLRPAGDLPSLVIPHSLQDSLEARLDLLGVGKEVAQVGAVLGDAFPFRLLRAVWDGSESTLREGLDSLTAARLLAESGTPPEVRYAFEHALIQDVAYASLLRSSRAEIHRRAAQALERQFPESVTRHPELVAGHFLGAGDGESAVPYLIQAAEQALARSANQEAIAHLTRACEAVRRLSPSTTRDSQEMSVLVMLGTAWIHTQGYTSTNAEDAFRRARGLSRVVGSSPGLFGAVFGLFTYHFVKDQMEEALTLAEDLHSLAEGSGDPGLLQAAHTSLAAVLLARGRPRDARTAAEAVLALYDPARDRPLARTFGQDFGVTARAYLSWILWAMGMPDSALQQCEESLRMAREGDHPHTLALALSFADTLAYLCGAHGQAVELADELIQLSLEQGFPHWLADASVIRGCALVALGRFDEGVDGLMRGKEGYRALGGELQLAFLAPFRVEALHAAGRTEAAKQELDSAIEGAQAGSKGGWWLGELYRLRSRITLSSGGPTDAVEEDLRRALEECERTGSKSLGRRAVTDLARLLMGRGEVEEARRVLDLCLAEVSEGLESPEVLAARDVAARLGA